MDELGTILRETRQARGLSLEDVAQVTRIRVRYLDALEEGRYDVLPTPVHVRGFLRNFALYLKLDPDPLIARYNASRRMIQDIPLQKQVRPELDKVPSQPPETLDDELEAQPVFFRPIGGRVRAPAWFSSEILVGVLVIIVLGVFVVYAGSRFVMPAITGGDATETPLAEASSAPTSTPALDLSSPTPEVELVTQLPTRPPIFTTVQLEITVVERGWLMVEVDGETMQEGVVESGELYSWEGQQQVKLRSGNGAGLSVILNGQELGLLGGRGEVVEKIWGLTGDIAPTPTLTVLPSLTPTLVPTESITGTIAPAEN